MRSRIRVGKSVAYTPTGAERADARDSSGLPWPALIVGLGVGPRGRVTLQVFAPDGNVFAVEAALGRGGGTYDPSDVAVRQVRGTTPRKDPDSRLDAIDGRVDVLEAGAAGVEGLHRETTARVEVADATNEATAIALANALRTAYEAHRADADAHLAADAANALTAPAASDAASLYALVNDLKAVLNEGHFLAQASHVGVLPAQLFAIDDLRFPANASNPIGAGTSTADFNADRGTLEFGGSGNEYAAFQAQMPHAWAAGTPIQPHVHWIQQEAGGVVWQLEYQILGVGETLATYPDWTVLAAEQNPGAFTYTSGFLHQLTTFPEIDMSGYGESTMLNIRLSRQGTDGADTMSAQAEMLEFDIHYRRDKFGTFDTSPAEAGIFPVGIQGARAVTAIDASTTAQAVILVNELRRRLNEHLVS